MTIKLNTLSYSVRKIKNLYSLLFLGSWAYYFYQIFLIYESNKHLKDSVLKMDFMSNEIVSEEILAVLINIGKLSLFLVAVLVLLYVVSSVAKKIPLRKKTLNTWNVSNQINPMLAHRLISYFTYNTSISIYDFCNISDGAKREAEILSYNYADPNLRLLFSRFEPDLVRDIKVYNKYFPRKSFLSSLKEFFSRDKKIRMDEAAATKLLTKLVNENSSIKNILPPKEDVEVIQENVKDKNENKEVVEIVESNGVNKNRKEPVLEDESLINKEKKDKSIEKEKNPFLHTDVKPLIKNVDVKNDEDKNL